jgi:hypothetical protein
VLAIDSALGCLRRVGIDLAAHPTIEQLRAEHETVWQTLNGRPIESPIDLPLMTDPEIQAGKLVLSVLAGPATFTDFQLFCLLASICICSPRKRIRRPRSVDLATVVKVSQRFYLSHGHNRHA